MNKEKLNAKKRTVVGKKVKNLRKKGLLPATLYGKKIKSNSLEVDLKDFLKVFKKAGKTSLVELIVEGEKDALPVLIHNVQRYPLNNSIIHADFYQVDLKEKVKAEIPILSVNEAKAVTDKKGVLLHVLSVIEVEALPADLPEHLEVNVESLAEVDQSIFVKDLKLDKTKISVLTNPEEIVFKIGSLVTKEMEEEIKAEEAAKAAAEAAAAEAAGATTTAPAEGQAEKQAEPAKEAAPKEEKPQ